MKFMNVLVDFGVTGSATGGFAVEDTEHAAVLRERERRGALAGC